MLGCVPNGSCSAGRMPIARSGTTILMPRPVTAGSLLPLSAPGAKRIGRWGGSIKCTSAYSSHATLQQVPMKLDHVCRVGTRSVANGGHGAQSAPLPYDSLRAERAASVSPGITRRAAISSVTRNLSNGTLIPGGSLGCQLFPPGMKGWVGDRGGIRMNPRGVGGWMVGMRGVGGRALNRAEYQPNPRAVGWMVDLYQRH
jgi:hypothetical protein